MDIRKQIILLCIKEKILDEYLKEYSKYIEDLEADIAELEEANIIRKIEDEYLIIKVPDNNKDAELAQKLMDLFPEGKKAGQYWKGSLSMIVSKLKSFKKKVGVYPDELIIKATTNYVNSFNDFNRDSAMSLLKYFIMKNGESILESYINDLLDNKSVTSNITLRSRRL